MKFKGYNLSQEIAECVGLWLAEGDTKCNNEITFTNNSTFLINHFHRNINKLFNGYHHNIRLYVYSNSCNRIIAPIKVDKINYYTDLRATKPYFIWRLASCSLNKEWKTIVSFVFKTKTFEEALLRGFFAGEGNIKTGSNNNRTIRIAQKQRSDLVERILNNLSVNHTFRAGDRSYYICNRENWDRLAKIRIADLHPIKKEKFWKTYSEFKEYHYSPNHLKNNLPRVLTNPKTTKVLDNLFKRSSARIYDILGELKKDKMVVNFRVGSTDYWVKNSNKVVISRLKQKYLNVLGDNGLSTKEISGIFKVCWKSSFCRLKELEKLGLVKITKDKRWQKIKTNKKVIAL